MVGGSSSASSDYLVEHVEKNERKRKTKNDEEKQILLKQDELSIVQKKEHNKKKKEENKVLLFENDEIVEYTPLYVQNKSKHIVLAEEEYVNTLEKLIEKNYFPDIAKYKLALSSEQEKNTTHKGDVKDRKRSQTCLNEYDSPSVRNVFNDFISENSDLNKSKERGDNLYKNNNSSLIKYFDEESVDANKNKKKYQLILLPNGEEHKINVNMSLQEFQHKYTSEDNKSFDCLINKMKNVQVEKNLQSIEKRKKHNELMEQVEKYTKDGVNCHILHTNRAGNEELMRNFSSGQRISDIIEVKKHKIHINSSNTRFSTDDNHNIEKQIDGAEETKYLKLLKKINEDKTEQMIMQGKFHLLKGNNGYDYISTPITEAGKGSECSSSIKRGHDAYSSKTADSENESDKSSWDKISTCKSRKNNGTYKSTVDREKEIEEEDIIEEEDEEHKNEFRLQNLSKRELIADRLQNNIKNLKHNKQALRKKYLKGVINKRFSSKMSTTSFKHSVLSKYSQKRLNELAQKSSLASQLLRNKGTIS